MDCKKLVYTVDELGVVLGISRPTAYALVHKAGFPKIVVGRRILIPVDGLTAYLERESGVSA